MSKRFKWQWAVIIPPPPPQIDYPLLSLGKLEWNWSRAEFLVLIVKVFVIKFAIFYRKCFVLCIIYTSSLNALFTNLYNMPYE